MDRAISVSAQRLGSMLRHRPAVSLPDRLKAAFVALGLTVSTVAITKAEASEGYILTASGFHADGTPYAFASAPFIGDPVSRAEHAAADIVKAHTGETTVTESTASTIGLAAVTAATTAPAKPGDLKSTLDRLRARKAAFAANMASTVAQTEDALTKAEDHLKGQQAEAQAFLDEVNQLSNGGPA
jgi:hypothetical protein